jgi:hypothetical protein
MDAETSRKSAAGLPPAIRALLAELWRGAVEPNCLADWATDQLVAGLDSPNLRIRAGLSGDDGEETRSYFARALADLGIPVPDQRECLIQQCGDIARDVLGGAMAPFTAFGVLWRITRKLNYPAVLRCWTRLDCDLDIMDDRELPVAQREEAVRQACKHFLAVLDGYTQTGIARLSLERSLEALRVRGLEVPASAAQIPERMPKVDDDGNEGVSFFRTRVETEDFRDLTLPWTMFLRSEIVGCRFENADLSESSMTWCDWKNCNFMNADLQGCDLRRSVFKDCEFYEAALDGADFRGAQFIDCRFNHASMKETKLEKPFGLFPAIRRRQLRLSKDQMKQIAWARSLGEEPPGG